MRRAHDLDQLGKRVYLQEFPGKNPPVSGGLGAYLSAAIGGTRNGVTRVGWLSGSLFWSLNATDSHTPAAPSATARTLTDLLDALFASN